MTVRTGCDALQKVELKAAKVVHVGTCDNSAGNYALAKKKMSMEVNTYIAPLMPCPQTPYSVKKSEYQALRLNDNLVNMHALCDPQTLETLKMEQFSSCMA